LQQRNDFLLKSLSDELSTADRTKIALELLNNCT